MAGRVNQSASVEVHNPHSILAALQRRPSAVEKVSFPAQSKDPVWDEIDFLSKKHRIRVEALKGGGSREGRSSAHGALIKPVSEANLDKLLDSPQDGQLWLALDCIQDPQNLGAIFRCASFFGVRGILMTEERSAPLTGTVYDVSCGGVESVPFVQVTNLRQAFEKLKEAGIWILGTSEHVKQPLSQVKADRPWCLVVGNEEKGMRRLTEELCDQVVTIPSHGFVTSLNVSVATGILIAHFRT